MFDSMEGRATEGCFRFDLAGERSRCRARWFKNGQESRHGSRRQRSLASPQQTLDNVAWRGRRAMTMIAAAAAAARAKGLPAPALSPATLTIFGAGGDLTKRLIVPALYNLVRAGKL